MKVKMKRVFKFKKIKVNTIIKKKGPGEKFDQYEYNVIKDNDILSIMIRAAAANNLEICSFCISDSDNGLGYVVTYGAKTDFINFISDILEQLNDYISPFQF